MQELSELAFDLALSRVRLAVAKAKARLELSPADLQAAAQLSEELLRRLGGQYRATSLPAKLVPDDALRSQLEEGMRTLTPPQRQGEFLQTEILEEILPSVSEMAKSGKLSSEGAASLLERLFALMPRPADEKPFAFPESLTGATR
jgi:hypothetical protein